MQSTDKKKSIIIVGSGGHACVVADVLFSMGVAVLGFTDVKEKLGHKVLGNLSVVGTDEILEDYNSDEVDVVIGVGYLPNNDLRHKLYNDIKKKHLHIRSIIHPSAVIGQEVNVGEGVQIFAGSILQAKVQLGDNVIINTGVNIDHHSKIGNHSHIAPGAVICGDVEIGNNSFIGAGVCIIQGISIGDNVVVGAGVTVRNNIQSGNVYVGESSV